MLFRSSSPTRVHIVHERLRTTLLAVRAAERISSQLGFAITVVAARPVPYPLALEPQLDIERRIQSEFKALLSACRSDIDVRIYWCRDRLEATAQAMPASSIVLIPAPLTGLRRLLFRFTEMGRLTARLRRDGHRVLLIPT